MHIEYNIQKEEKMNGIKINAYAKINLGLHVIGKRADGYHEVKMIMQAIALHDEIRICKSKENGIRVRTNLPYLPVDQRNLAYRAAKLCLETFGVKQMGVSIFLEKQIPVSAGLAGGSADAAATLLGMYRLFEKKEDRNELLQKAKLLGADVPFCLTGGTALAEGVGEILTALPAPPDSYVVLVKPAFSVSTRQVYQAFSLENAEKAGDMEQLIQKIKQKDIQGMCRTMGNVLETVTIKKHPIIRQIKNQMLQMGALAALMSGSGPTVFGLFLEKEQAQQCCKYFETQKEIEQVKLTYFWNDKGDRI